MGSGTRFGAWALVYATAVKSFKHGLYLHSHAVCTLTFGKPMKTLAIRTAVVLQVMKTTGSLQCEIPNANLHHFKGRFQFLAEDSSKPHTH